MVGSHYSRQRPEPIVDILSGLVFGDAVALLDLAFQLVTTSVDDVEVVVGEIAPFLFGKYAGEEYPTAQDARLAGEKALNEFLHDLSGPQVACRTSQAKLPPSR